MLTHVEFWSAAFPPYEGESEEINPGRFGKRLAEFFATELGERGETIGEIFAEDWGWVMPVENTEFGLWIGVGNYEELPDGFLCFIEPHTAYVRKFWKKIPTQARVEAVQKRMADALKNHSEIYDIKWYSHEEFHSVGA